MIRPILRVVAVGLAVCILLLSAVVYPQVVAHAAHHAHHKAATHASALCTWMCAAGQVLETISVCLQAELGLLTFLNPLLAQKPVGILPATPSTRGPPPLFFL